MQFNFARNHRKKHLRAVAFDVLQWYRGLRLAKKQAYEKARTDRKRIQSQ